MTGVKTSHDRLRGGDLLLTQPRDGYRFSVDALLLAHFAGGREGVTTIADLGTGCGVVGLMLCRRYPEARVTAFENNADLAACAALNASRNGLGDRFRVVESDILLHKTVCSVSSFDLVVSNPPFRTAASGKTSPRAGRDTARHESTAGLADFLAVAKYLVKPGGRICFIHHPSRLPEFIACSQQLKLALLRIRMVHGTRDGKATMFLAELAKGSRGGLTVEAPLIVRDAGGEYSSEVAGMIGEKAKKTSEVSNTSEV